MIPKKRAFVNPFLRDFLQNFSPSCRPPYRVKSFVKTRRHGGGRGCVPAGRLSPPALGAIAWRPPPNRRLDGLCEAFIPYMLPFLKRCDIMGLPHKLICVPQEKCFYILVKTHSLNFVFLLWSANLCGASEGYAFFGA